MPKKKARVPKSGVVWHQSAVEATLSQMPKYNAHACGTGAHGDSKYNRAKQKRSWQRELQREDARNRGRLPFLRFCMQLWARSATPSHRAFSHERTTASSCSVSGIVRDARAAYLLLVPWAAFSQGAHGANLLHAIRFQSCTTPNSLQPNLPHAAFRELCTILTVHNPLFDAYLAANAGTCTIFAMHNPRFAAPPRLNCSVSGIVHDVVQEEPNLAA